jgi:outer membrane protein assembly factor BamB
MWSLSKGICVVVSTLGLVGGVARAADVKSDAADSVAHRLLISDDTKHHIAIVDKSGKIEWEYKINNLHDLHYLPGGTILFHKNYQTIVEVDPKTNQVVWQYDASKANGNEGKRMEAHAFQRLADGNTMVAESGVGRIIEVDRAGKRVKEIKLKRNHPSAHSDTRLVRKLENGHYLASQEADGTVREYDGDGKVVWEYEVPLFGNKPAPGHGPEAFGNQTFEALRLASGNTLISLGNGHGIIEVTPDKKIVWELHQHDLPGITLAWVTTLQIMPNGNIVFGNCHAGPDNPQVIEVTRDKKVVWTFKDMKNFGNSTTNSQVLDVEPVVR